MQLAEYTVRFVAEDTVDPRAARQALDEVAGPAAVHRFVAGRMETRAALEKVEASVVARHAAMAPAAATGPDGEREAAPFDVQDVQSGEPDRVPVLELIAAALKRCEDPRIAAVSFENDHKSGELILTLREGGERCDWVIRSRSVEPLA